MPAGRQHVYILRQAGLQSEETGMFEDKTLVCKDCGQEFVFTAGEQEFFAARGFQNEPGRCRECRAARKSLHGSGAKREMFDAVCARCGKEAKVPFKPRLGKPVYCSECFSDSDQA